MNLVDAYLKKDFKYMYEMQGLISILSICDLSNGFQ